MEVLQSVGEVLSRFVGPGYFQEQVRAVDRGVGAGAAGPPARPLGAQCSCPDVQVEAVPAPPRDPRHPSQARVRKTPENLQHTSRSPTTRSRAFSAAHRPGSHFCGLDRPSSSPAGSRSRSVRARPQRRAQCAPLVRPGMMRLERGFAAVLDGNPMETGARNDPQPPTTRCHRMSRTYRARRPGATSGQRLGLLSEYGVHAPSRVRIPPSPPRRAVLRCGVSASARTEPRHPARAHRSASSAPSRRSGPNAPRPCPPRRGRCPSSRCRSCCRWAGSP